MLLHLARDFQLAVQSLPLRHLPSDCRRQTGNFLGQGRLGGRLCLDTVESGSDRAFCELVRFDFMPCNQIRGEALLVSIVPQRTGDKVPQATVRRRRDLSQKLLESGTAGIENS